MLSECHLLRDIRFGMQILMVIESHSKLLSKLQRKSKYDSRYKKSHIGIWLPQ